jgi:hypothetical protein
MGASVPGGGADSEGIDHQLIGNLRTATAHASGLVTLFSRQSLAALMQQRVALSLSRDCG